MNRLNLKRQLSPFLLNGLVALYILTGLVFISTRSPGGVSLGFLFIGGAVLLYLGFRLLEEIKCIRVCLTKQLVMSHFPSNSAPNTGRVMTGMPRDSTLDEAIHEPR